MIKKKRLRKILIGFLTFGVFLSPFFSLGKTIHPSDQGGDWNNPNSWLEGEIPQEDDDVHVNSKIRWPKELKIKSLILNPGDYRLKNNSDVDCDIFEIKKGVILKTLKREYSPARVLNIKAQKVINNGEVTYPIELHLNANLINNGTVTSWKDNYGRYKNPNIFWSGGYIENNSEWDPQASLKILPNTKDTPYYFFGEKPINIILNSSSSSLEYHFKSSLNLNHLSNYREDKIFLDDGEILKIKQGNFNIVVPQKNTIIVEDKIHTSYASIKIDARNSDVFILGPVPNKKIIANKIYLDAENIYFPSGEFKAEELYISEKTKLSLGSGSWYSQKHVDLNIKNIINKGEIFFNNRNILIGDLYNLGLLSWPYSRDPQLHLQGDLYNYNQDSLQITLKSKETPTVILNKAEKLRINLIEDIEFSQKTIFNFDIKSYDKNITLSKDTEFFKNFHGGDINFLSKSNEILNLRFHQSIGRLKNAKSFNLIMGTESHTNLYLSEKTLFNKLIVLKGDSLGVKGTSTVWSNRDIYFTNKIINNGDLDFYTPYNRVKSYTASSIENHGVITGQVVFGFEDRRKFKYIISENEVLTEEEKNELENSDILTRSINLTPKLNEIGKNYFIHYILENETEEKTVPLKKEVEEVETNFAQEDSTLPEISEIPTIPEPLGDRMAPVIQLNGSQNIELIVGEEYQELGAMAQDNIDGNLTNQIQISGSVDIHKIGTYQITYEVSDLVGNTAIKIRTIKIISADQTPPIIILNGDELVELKAGENYLELGASALDETDGDLTNQINIESNIDLTHTGNYEVKYSVSDLAGNLTEKIRTVKITEGNSSVGLPQPQPSSHHGKSGKKIKRSGKNGEKIYVCKDSRALNFSNVGVHKESLCIWRKEGGEEVACPEAGFVDWSRVSRSTLASWKKNGCVVNEKKEKALSDEELKKKAEELLKKLEEEKREKEEENILLKSTCLKIQSKEKSIRRGSKDKESIKKLQYFLKNHGYSNGRIDGGFGPITKTSLKNFQENNGLYVDGILGKGTIRFIDRNCGNIKDRSYWEKKREDKRRGEERLEKKKGGEEKAEDFASQNPPKQNPRKKFNLEKEDTIYHQKYANTLYKTQEYTKDIKRDAQNISKLLRDDLEDVDGPFESVGYFVASSVIGFVGASIEAYDIAKVEMGLIALGLENAFLDWETKKFFFDIYNNSANEDKHDKHKNTVIIIHGYQAESTGDWIQEVASQLHNTQTEVLLLDWNGITKNFKIWNDTKNIDEIADKVSDKLIEWKIEPEKTRFIGHSLGSLMSAEISRKLKSKTGRTVKEIVALDPAASLSGTEYNINSSKDFPGFRNTASNVKCFTGTSSLWGDNDKTQQCDEKIWIDMPALKFEHGGVHEIYRQILGRNTLYNNLLSTKNTVKFREVTLETQGWKFTDDLELTSLPLKRENKYVEYGSEVDNEFSCEDTLLEKIKDICEFYGWKGDDTFDLNPKTKESYFKDFKSDKGADKIFIDGDYKDIRAVEDKNKVRLFVRYEDVGWKVLNLEGVKKEQVDKWIEIVTGKYISAEKSKKLTKDYWETLQKDNPIQIK